MLNQMFNLKLAEAGYWCWAAGVLLTGLVLLVGALGLLPAAAEWVRLTLPLNLLGSLLFLLTLLQILRAKPLN